jgi:hypothetical protein
VANPAFKPGAFFKENMVTPRVLEKSQKESEHDRKLAKAYAAVDEREKNMCQVSGVMLFPSSQNERTRREHHHLKGRNVKPEWVYEPKRILLVSAYIHKLLQSKVILVYGTDATKPLAYHWNRQMVKPGKEPIQLEKVA